MQQREVEIVNKLGLHARASAKLTQLAARYQCDVAMDAIVALIGDYFGEGQ